LYNDPRWREISGCCRASQWFSIDVRDMPMNLPGLRMRMARNEKSYDHFLASH